MAAASSPPCRAIILRARCHREKITSTGSSAGTSTSNTGKGKRSLGAVPLDARGLDHHAPAGSAKPDPQRGRRRRRRRWWWCRRRRRRRVRRPGNRRSKRHVQRRRRGGGRAAADDDDDDGDDNGGRFLDRHLRRHPLAHECRVGPRRQARRPSLQPFGREEQAEEEEENKRLGSFALLLCRRVSPPKRRSRRRGFLLLGSSSSGGVFFFFFFFFSASTSSNNNNRSNDASVHRPRPRLRRPREGKLPGPRPGHRDRLAVGTGAGDRERRAVCFFR